MQPSSVALHSAFSILNCCAAAALENAGVRNRPPAELDLADDVFLRDELPVPAVGAVVPMVAHHEVVPVWNPFRPPVVVAAVFLRDEVIGDGRAVDVHLAVDEDRKSVV